MRAKKCKRRSDSARPNTLVALTSAFLGRRESGERVDGDRKMLVRRETSMGGLEIERFCR